MANSIHSIIFMHIVLRLESAMSIGTGEKNAVVCDENGIPYIPATSLAGVLRHGMSKETGDRLFGRISLERGNHEISIPSKIIVGNGWMNTEKGFIFAYREGVGLKADRTPLDGAKYSILAVDRGAEFEAGFEFEFSSEEEENTLFPAFCEALARMHQGEITLGRKHSRGLGRVIIDQCTWKRYAQDHLLDSIHHTRDKEKPLALPENVSSQYKTLKYTIRLQSTLCIREYVSVHHHTAQELEEPNYVQMTSGGIPVIPGMSWAGVFRHGAQNILCRLGVSTDRSEALCAELFGCIQEGKHVSNVSFADTYLKDHKNIRGRRTAVNRFSGCASNGALYAEDFVAAKSNASCGELCIRIKPNLPCSDWGHDLMHLLLRELDCGRLHIGGNGSIGRGLFRVDNLEERNYPALAALIQSEYTGKAERSEA